MYYVVSLDTGIPCTVTGPIEQGLGREFASERIAVRKCELSRREIGRDFSESSIVWTDTNLNSSTEHISQFDTARFVMRLPGRQRPDKTILAAPPQQSAEHSLASRVARIPISDKT